MVGRSKGQKDPSYSSHLPFSFCYLPLTKARQQPEVPGAPRGPLLGAQRRAERVLQVVEWVGGKQRITSYSGSLAISQLLHTPPTFSTRRGWGDVPDTAMGRRAFSPISATSTQDDSRKSPPCFGPCSPHL